MVRHLTMTVSLEGGRRQASAASFEGRWRGRLRTTNEPQVAPSLRGANATKQSRMVKPSSYDCPAGLLRWRSQRQAVLPARLSAPEFSHAIPKARHRRAIAVRRAASFHSPMPVIHAEATRRVPVEARRKHAPAAFSSGACPRTASI